MTVGRPGVRRRTRLAALVAVLASLIAMAATQGTPAAAQIADRPSVVPDDVAAGIEALLAVRVAEVTRGSGSASLHRDALEATSERWGNGVAGFHALDLELYREELTDPVLDLTPPALVERGAGVYVVEVRRAWQVRGIDAHPAQESIFLAVALERSGESTQWRVIDDDPLRSIGLTSTRALWEVTEIEVVREGVTALVGAPSEVPRMRQVASLLDTATAGLPQLDIPEAYLVVVPNGAAQAKAFMQTPLDVTKFVAFVSFSVDRDESWRAGPPRLVLQEGNLRRRTESRQVSILRHELVHIAALGRAGPITPVWIHEGYAEWEANGRTATAGGSLPIPDAYTFRAGAVSEIVAAYDRSEALFARLAQLVGDDGPQQFFDTVGATRSAAGTVRYHVDRALGLLGLDRATLENGNGGR